MNSYIYLVSEMNRTREQLRRALESPPEAEETDKVRTVARRPSPNLEAAIWFVGVPIVFSGVLMAAQWQRHLFWLLVWPVPIAFAFTIFVFVRQGFYFENGVLVLGRRR